MRAAAPVILHKYSNTPFAPNFLQSCPFVPNPRLKFERAVEWYQLPVRIVQSNYLRRAKNWLHTKNPGIFAPNRYCIAGNTCSKCIPRNTTPVKLPKKEWR